MFNRRINARLEIFEEACRFRMDDLEKSIKQITCKHESVVFKEKYHPGYNTCLCFSPEWTERWKECTLCGKRLGIYGTSVVWLEARLKDEKKAAEKGKKKTTKKANK